MLSVTLILLFFFFFADWQFVRPRNLNHNNFSSYISIYERNDICTSYHFLKIPPLATRGIKCLETILLRNCTYKTEAQVVKTGSIIVWMERFYVTMGSILSRNICMYFFINIYTVIYLYIMGMRGRNVRLREEVACNDVPHLKLMTSALCLR